MKSIITRVLCAVTALTLILCCASCGKKVEMTETASADSIAATKDEATAAVTDSSNADASQSDASAHPSDGTEGSEVITYTEATEAPAAPSKDEVLSYGSSDPGNIYDASGFVSVSDVIPDVVLDIRYATTYNFVGDVINGYDEPLAILTKEAAAALMDVNDDLKEQGYRLKIYDAYRPQRAVNHFVSWSNDWSDTRMKNDFYPELDKSVLFDYGYIAYYSGHSRGSTVDLSLVYADSGEDVDMGGTFDYFGSLSHPDYTGISSEQYNNRMILRQAMVNNGFTPLSTEWWHFTLSYEPYPSTYFDFTVSSSSLNN